jgi:hypothetical protein
MSEEAKSRTDASQTFNRRNLLLGASSLIAAASC